MRLYTAPQTINNHKTTIMKLKKYTLSLIASFFVITSWAQEMSEAAKNFRSNLQSFLREEGFSPSIDDEGDIVFKKEGVSYYLSVLGDKPIYVIFMREPIGAEDASEPIVLKALNDINTNVRTLKCSLINNYVRLAIESYWHVVEDFKYVFYTYLQILEYSNEIVKTAYAEYDNTQATNKNSSTSNSAIGSVYGHSANKSYINGPVCESSHHKWWATEIELNSAYTFVHKIVVPKVSNTYVCSTKDEYIEDCDTGKKYYIIASTIGIYPQTTTLYSKEAKSFMDTYPALPQSVKRINIWSGSDYYVKNLQIR